MLASPAAADLRAGADRRTPGEAEIRLDADSLVEPPTVMTAPPPTHRSELRRVLVRDGQYFEPRGERKRLSVEERDALRRELRESMREVYPPTGEHR
ncbi:MAG: hypothetical protein ACK4KV_02220 [Rhodocyclaceae bacterium]